MTATARLGQMRWGQWGARVTSGVVRGLSYVADRHSWPRSSLVHRCTFELQGLVVLAVVFAYHAYFAQYGVDPHHDGIMFKPALDVSQGQMVFRDTFTQYGGVTVLLQAAALKLFGARLLIIKLQTALMYALAFYLFWRAWARLVPSVLATVACLIGSQTAPDAIASALPWSSVYAAAFQALALLLVIRFFERGREWELVLAGMAAAAAFWCRQPVGVLLAGGLLIAVFLAGLHVSPNYARAPSAWSVRSWVGAGRLGRAVGIAILFGGGLLLFNGAILLWLTRYGALEDWWKQSILFAQHWSSKKTGGHPLEEIIKCLFPSGHLLVWCLMATVVAVQAMRSTAVFLDPKSGEVSRSDATVLFASTVAVTSWAQFYPVCCDYHCHWAGIPMFGVFAYAFYSSHSSSSKLTRTLVGLFVLGLVFYHDLERRVDAFEPRARSQNATVAGIEALRGIRMGRGDAASFGALRAILDEYLAVHPEGTIVTTTGDGLFPALGPRQARFHPMYVNWEMPVYPEAETVRARFIDEHQPLVIGDLPKLSSRYVYVGRLGTKHQPKVYVPKDVSPTEVIECDGGATCKHRPLR